MWPVVVAAAAEAAPEEFVVVSEDDDDDDDDDDVVEEDPEKEEEVAVVRDFRISSPISIIPFEYTSEDSPKSSNPFVAATSISVHSSPGYPPRRKNSAAAFG